MRRVARLLLDYRRVFFAALFCVTLAAPASASTPQFRRVGTIDAATATANQACYWNGSDLECNSTNPTITATGLVGIGTTSPAFPLDVAVNTGTPSYVGITNGLTGAGADPSIILERWNGSGTNYLGASIDNIAGALQFSTASGSTIGSQTFTSRMYISTGGLVGIGSTSPVASLDLSQKTDAVSLPVGTSGNRPTGVNGMIRYNNTLSALEAYANGAWTSLAGSGALAGSGTTNYVAKWTSPTALGIGTLYDDGSGRVGIGTVSPGYTLQVNGALGAISNCSSGYPTVATTGFELCNNFVSGQSAVDLWNTATGFTGGFQFHQMTGTGAQTTVMDITGAGNVGIGTTTPVSNLDVFGNIVDASNTVQLLGYSGAEYKSLSYVHGTVTPTADILFDTEVAATFALMDQPQSSHAAANVTGSSFYASNENTSPNASNGSVTGGDAEAYNFGNVGSLYGIFGYTEQDSGTSNEMIAVDGEDYIAGGTTADIYGVYANPVSYLGTVTGSMNGVYIKADIDDGNGAVANRYGLYVDTPNGSVGSGGDDFGLYIAGTQKSFFGGNVGIGTTSPGHLLEVEAAATGPQIAAVFGNSDTGATTSEARIVFNQGGAYYQGISGAYNTDVPYLAFSVNSTASTWAEKMRIQSNGNVGIGTTSPAGTLDVEGGTSGSGNGTNITLAAQNGKASGNTNGGTIILTPGTANGSGTAGGVAVGTTSVPASVTESVNGLIKVAGTGSEPCTSAQVGSIRYNPTGNYFELCSYP